MNMMADEPPWVKDVIMHSKLVIKFLTPGMMDGDIRMDHQFDIRMASLS